MLYNGNKDDFVYTPATLLTTLSTVSTNTRLSNYFSYLMYRQIFNIRRTLVGNKIVDHSDVVGASPVGAAPTTSSFSSWLQYIAQRQLQDETRKV